MTKPGRGSPVYVHEQKRTNAYSMDQSERMTTMHAMRRKGYAEDGMLVEREKPKQEEASPLPERRQKPQSIKNRKVKANAKSQTNAYNGTRA